MANFFSEPSAIYALSRLPLKLQWGTNSGGALDDTKYISKNGKSIRTWILAEVISVTFMSGELPAPTVSIRFVPLLKNDRARAADIENRLSFPTLSKYSTRSPLSKLSFK